LSQSDPPTTTTRKIPAGLVPVLVFLGLAFVLFLSNQRMPGAQGRPLIGSPQEYSSFSDEAMNLSKDALQKWDRGETLLPKDKENLEKAMVKYDSMNDYNPSLFEPVFASAKIAIALGRVETADLRVRQALLNGEEALRRAKSSNDSNKLVNAQLALADAHYVNSRVKFAQEDYAAALSEAQLAVRTVQTAPVYWWAVGSAALQVGDMVVAKGAASNAIRLDPTMPSAIGLMKLIGL